MNSERKIAYFSMEIGIKSEFPTYSGGLGVLAGDTIRSCADLGIPLVAITLLYRKGYFHQELDEEGNQVEYPDEWNPWEILTPVSQRIQVSIEGRTVHVIAWEHQVCGIGEYEIPILFLDTDLPENGEYDRSLSWWLYGGDERYRISQEIVLGIGGVRMLNQMGYHHIDRYHMNEGHPGFLVLELLRESLKNHSLDSALDEVKRKCVFTTHTPVPAGHDKFPYELVKKVLGDFLPMKTIREIGGEDHLNMTRLALNSSHYINGVAKRHGAVSREMFPGYHIDFITNGVHAPTWSGNEMQALFDKYIPDWIKDPSALRSALGIPEDEIWEAHEKAKQEIINQVNERTGMGMDYDTFTIGFARRATAYKRADLIFHDTNRLREISRKMGKIQLIFAGKAHMNDNNGQDIIKKIFSLSQKLRNHLRIAYLENYNMKLAKLLVSGVDMWLNTPRKPNEASGTSGMKAALNGVPSLSILDGWWIEGCIEDITGWSIGSALEAESDDAGNAASLYEKLEKIVPLFYQDRKKWISIMKHAISINGSYFNSHRMIRQYILDAYFT
jgi:starch phosphorylase